MRKPDQSSNAGYPEGAAHRGRLLFGYFFFGDARKSDLLPGNPGGSDVGLRDETANLTHATPLLQFSKEILHRQHPLLQIPILQLDAQFVLTRHLDMPFALDHGDDLHRVDRRVRHELDDDGLG